MTIFQPIGSFFPAAIGGPDVIMYWHAKALTSAGVEVWTATTDDGIPPDVPRNRWLKTDCGEVNYVRTRVHYAPARLLATAMGPLRRADVVHLNAVFYPSSWLLAPVALALGKPVVWTTHGELDPDALVYSAGRKQKVLGLIRRFSSQIVFHTTCAAETGYVREQFGPEARVFEVPYFTELPELLPRTDTRTLLYVGRIHPKKAIENLIDAVALSDVFKTQKWRLVIVGNADNEYGQGLRAQAERLGLTEKVVFAGHKKEGEKYQLMADAHAMVMPSHTENFGIVVTEALSQGTPVIASTGTPWEILETRQAGIWSDNAPEVLRTNLDRLLTLPAAAYAALRQRARALVETEFDIGPNIHRWTNFYEELIRRRVVQERR
jgi:glycosyltransferase involved in cell wall biosynthesis